LPTARIGIDRDDVFIADPHGAPLADMTHEVQTHELHLVGSIDLPIPTV